MNFIWKFLLPIWICPFQLITLFCGRREQKKLFCEKISWREKKFTKTKKKITIILLFVYKLLTVWVSAECRIESFWQIEFKTTISSAVRVYISTDYYAHLALELKDKRKFEKRIRPKRRTHARVHTHLRIFSFFSLYWKYFHSSCQHQYSVSIHNNNNHFYYSVRVIYT